MALTLIVYATKHGAVKAFAEKLSDRLEDSCTLVNCLKEVPPPLDDYSAVILGFSVHAGYAQKKIIKYVTNNIDKITARRFGLFCSCLSEENQAIEYFHKNFPAEIVKASHAIGIFGGIVDFEKMNLIERFIMKKITKSDKSFSTVDENSIDEFVKTFQQPTA